MSGQVYPSGAAFGSLVLAPVAACTVSPFSGQHFGQGNTSPVMGQM